MSSSRKNIDVVPYDPSWPLSFNSVEEELRKKLGSHHIATYHIGSTSVSGLIAKKDLDIICVVDDLRNALILKEIGFVFKGEINTPLRYFFSRNRGEEKVNLHVCEPENGFIALNLSFRDYLRTHLEARDQYASLKRTLLADPASYERLENRFSGYALGKDSFIKEILRKAHFDGVVVNFCLHREEWKQYHRIRKEEIFDPLDVIYDEKHPTIRDPKHFHFVLYHGTQIVSVAHVELLEGSIAVLRSLATDKPYRNKGYGSYLLNNVEKWSSYQGCKEIKLHLLSDHSGNFFIKRGYQKIFFNDPSIRSPCIDLGKSL